MFFFFPFYGGSFFSLLIFFLIIRFIFRLIGGFSRTRYYSNDDESAEEFFKRFNEQYGQGSYQSHSYNANTSFSKNWYSVLGLESSVSDEDLKKTYRKLVLKYHPDRFDSSDPVQKEEATRRFQEIQEAYEHICSMRGLN